MIKFKKKVIKVPVGLSYFFSLCRDLSIQKISSKFVHSCVSYLDYTHTDAQCLSIQGGPRDPA